MISKNVTSSGQRRLHGLHRQSKFDLPGRECIWVGKSTVTPGADRVIPITWDGPASRYILHPTIDVVGCTVDNTQFPLRSGPDYCPSEADAVTFDAFMEQFRYRPYTDPTCTNLCYQLLSR